MGRKTAAMRMGVAMLLIATYIFIRLSDVSVLVVSRAEPGVEGVEWSESLTGTHPGTYTIVVLTPEFLGGEMRGNVLIVPAQMFRSSAFWERILPATSERNRAAAILALFLGVLLLSLPGAGGDRGREIFTITLMAYLLLFMYANLWDVRIGWLGLITEALGICAVASGTGAALSKQSGK